MIQPRERGEIVGHEYWLKDGVHVGSCRMLEGYHKTLEEVWGRV